MFTPNEDRYDNKHGHENLAYDHGEAKGHVELREVGRASERPATTVNEGQQSKNACKTYLIFVIILCVVIAVIVGITIGIDAATDGQNKRTNRPTIVPEPFPTTTSSPEPQCGDHPARRSTSSRIIGGSNARLGDWPWMVSLRDRLNIHQCASVIVNNNTAITAAHCVGRFETAVLGDLKLSTQSPYHLEMNVWAIRHHLFNSNTLINDIAVVIFDPPIQYINDYVRPICLDIQDNITDYEACFVTGWGHTKQDGHVSNIMQEAQVELFDLADCESFYSDRVITPNMICAGQTDGRTDTCQGDTGGPLQCMDQDGRFHLVGITSFGYGCGRQNYPGVYTRVSHFQEFIQNEGYEDPTPVDMVVPLGNSSFLQIYDQSTADRLWIISSSDGEAIDVLVQAVDIERARSLLLIGVGDDPFDPTSIVASSETFIANFFRVFGQSVWLRYKNDGVVSNTGFSVTFEANIIENESSSCEDKPCDDDLNTCHDFSTGYSCICRESTSFPCNGTVGRFVDPSPQIDCDFERGLCGWEQIRFPRDEFDWSFRYGKTPSSTTGPSTDHTRRNNYGTYIYIETSGPDLQSTASIISPKITKTPKEKICFTFFYHMYGSTIWLLRIHFLHENTREQETLWTRFGDMGDVWLFGQVDLNNLSNGWIIIEGMDGDGFRSDIAIDDIKLTKCVLTDIDTNILLQPDDIVLLSSPAFPSTYPNDVTITWTVTIPDELGFQTDIDFMSIESTFDELVIGRGLDPSDEDSILKVFTGKRSSLEETSYIWDGQQNYWIRFKTDLTIRDTGFMIFIRPVNLTASFPTTTNAASSIISPETTSMSHLTTSDAMSMASNPQVPLSSFVMPGESLNLTYPLDTNDSVKEFVFGTNQSFGFHIIFHSIILPYENQTVIVFDHETVIEWIQGTTDETDDIFVAGNTIRFAVVGGNITQLKIEVISIDLTDNYICSDHRSIINQSKVCDVIVDCASGSDEHTNCPTIMLAPLESPTLISFNYRNDLASNTMSNWRISSTDPALAVVVKLESIHLGDGDSLVIQSVSDFDNHRGHSWTMEGQLNEEWSETADKVFKDRQLMVTFHALEGLVGFELEIISVPFEELLGCNEADKVITRQNICDEIVDCQKLDDEIECETTNITELSFRENITIQSYGYPKAITTPRPFYRTWAIRTNDDSGIQIHIDHLVLEEEDDFVIGTGLDPRDDKSVIYQASDTNALNGSSPDIRPKGTELWITISRLSTTLAYPLSFSFQVFAVENDTYTCPADHVRCGDVFLQCFDPAYFCDGFPDCIDRYDEEDCECQSEGVIKCDQINLCLLRKTFCDGSGLCDDNCTFECSNGHRVSTRLVCDGFNDCGDYSDELQNCECSSVQYDCGERCIPKSNVCNGYIDCADGSDENDCKCRNFEIECENGKCTPYWNLCNGVDDCGDKTDEIEANCRYCNGNYYQCPDFSFCLIRSFVCDGYPSCKDGSDEIGCPSPPPSLTTDDADDVIWLNNTNGCYTLTFSNNGTNSSNNGMDYKWVIIARDEDSGMRLKLDHSSLRDQVDFLEIIVGSPEDKPVYRYTGVYGNISSSDNDTELTSASLNTTSSPSSIEICGNFSTPPENLTLLSTLYLNTSRILLRLTIGPNETNAQLSMQLASTHFENDFFECSTQMLIPSQQVCDNTEDCPLGEDEDVDECTISVNLVSSTPSEILISKSTSNSAFRDGEAVWVIQNAPNDTGIRIDFPQFNLTERSIMTIGIGSDRYTYASPAVVLTGMSAPKHVLLRSESVWIHVYKLINSSDTVRLVVTPQNFTDEVFLCSQGLVNLSREAVCDNTKHCIDGNDEYACFTTPKHEGCGLRPAMLNQRVVHGDDVTILGQWPWQIVLYRAGRSPSFHCAGSIIFPEWVITAAHCVNDDDETYSVQAGTLNHQINGGGQIRSVVQVFLHPDYDQSINIGAYDIALLKLDSPLEFNDNVQPVCLPDPDVDQPEPGSYVTYTGWGSITNLYGRNPDYLQVARQVVIPNEICIRNGYYNIPVVPSVFCTMYAQGFQSTCTGDSGGPAVQEIDGQWTIQGLTSFIGLCGIPYQPSGFTRVTSFLDFIADILKNN